MGCSLSANRGGTASASLYAWLEGADLLALKADRRPWLVVLLAERFLALTRRDNLEEVT